MLSPRRTSRGLLAQLVARVLIVALVLGLVPAPPAEASIAAPERSLPPLPSVESVPPVLLAVVVAVVGDDEAEPCAVVFVVADPHWASKYHRARWMDPGTGRFAGVDPFEGLPTQPSTLHSYLYAAADPLNKVDPSGQFNIGVQVTTFTGIQTTVASQSAASVTAIATNKLIVGTALAFAGGAGVLGPIGVLQEVRRRRVPPTGLYSFGNSKSSGPSAPRLDVDFGLPVGPGQYVGPYYPPDVRGKSAYGDWRIPRSFLRGFVYRLDQPYVSQGLAVMADGSDVLTGSVNPPTHHTIYPTFRMGFSAFVSLVFGMNWTLVPEARGPNPH
jgi:RHS repeat-associated protein